MDWNLNSWLLLATLVTTTSVACSLYVFVWSHRALGDEANERSLHQGKTLTAGGVFVVFPWLFYATWSDFDMWPLYGVWLMLLVGLADDVWHWSAKPKLLAQFLVTMILLFHCLPLWPFDTLLWLYAVFLLVAVMWWLNLYNFMDGANGIAGLHAVVALLFYVVILGHEPAHLSLMTGVLLGALFVFLVFNLVLGRLFMGDAGSLPLAYVQAWLGLYALSESLLTLPLLALLHASFVADATYTLFVRIRNRERLSEAHNTHFYQRWAKAGATHVTVSMAYAGLSFVCGVLCYLLIKQGAMLQWSVTLFIYLILALFFIKTLQLSR